MGTFLVEIVIAPFPKNKFHVPFIVWEQALCDGEMELCAVFPYEAKVCFLS